MPHLKYQDRELSSQDGESVLNALLRHDISVPYSCRVGVCHVCLQRCEQGTLPAPSQRGLRPELRERGYFMACKCIPNGDMAIEPPTELYSTATVHEKQNVTPDIARVWLKPTSIFVYQPAQFITLRRPDGLSRSYSLASHSVASDLLEIHVQRKDYGLMSNWVLDELQPGAEVELQGPNGENHYRPAMQDHPLLLIGLGTGLASLYGLVREAIYHGHRGAIHLYHECHAAGQFYLREELRQLEQQHPNFHYYECTPPRFPHVSGTLLGRAHEVAFVRHGNLQHWHVFLAGLAEMAEQGCQIALRYGVPETALHLTSFALRDLRCKARN